MTDNQLASTVPASFRSRRVAVGVASVLAAGALIGGSATAAVAATPQVPVPAATASASASGGASAGAGGEIALVTLAQQVHRAFFDGSVNGAAAQSVATRITADPAVLQDLPAALRSALTSLAGAPAAQRTADAENIAKTALSGGYGSQIEALATALEHSPSIPANGRLARQLRADLSGSGSLGQKAAEVARTIAGHPKLFGELPARLRTDLTTLGNAPAGDQLADVQKIEATALAGGYGVSIEKIARGLSSALATSVPGLGIG